MHIFISWIIWEEKIRIHKFLLHSIREWVVLDPFRYWLRFLFHYFRLKCTTPKRIKEVELLAKEFSLKRITEMKKIIREFFDRLFQSRKLYNSIMYIIPANLRVFSNRNNSSFKFEQKNRRINSLNFIDELFRWQKKR